MTMTKKEAIQILSTRDAHGVLCGYTSGVTEALDMAIEALSRSGDLISRANAMSKCKSAEKELTDEAERKGLRVARFIIGELPSADAEWIPCSERLPKEGEKVLASTTNTIFTQVFKGTHGTSDSWWWNNNTIKTIYAWMPLPKPYREKSEVEE